MRQYERNGVTVDQCTECRGIFLDRGELEHLTKAEEQFYRGSAQGGVNPQPGPAPTMPPRHYGSPGSPDSPDWRGGYQQQGYGRKRRRKSFLEDLFD